VKALGGHGLWVKIVLGGLNMNKSIISSFKFEVSIVISLLVGGLCNLFFQIVGAWNYFMTSCLILVLIFSIHLLILKQKPQKVYLYLYYCVRIKHIFKSLKHPASNSLKESVRKVLNRLLNRFFDDYYDSLILDSWASPSPSDTTWIQEKSYKDKPVFIRRDHLMAKNFWPNWAFSIVFLFNDLRITRRQDDVNNGDKFRLEVDLRDQSYGIYNNAGKMFMANKFLNEEKNNRYITKAKEIENFLKGKKLGNELEINAMNTPLRWASGGVLPIAYWKKNYWYVLFFRGITPPVGWNVANGASETKEEYKNLGNLMVREFSEELILLDREPQIDDPSPVTQKVFSFSGQIFDGLPDKNKDRIRSKEFIEKHSNLRKNHDSLFIGYEEGPRLEPIRTPFEIQVTYHSKNSKESHTKKIEDVIFSVNPLEFGIECISLHAFKMDDDDYPIYGEIWEVADCLLREPVLLLSCDYVQEVFEKNGGTLGEHIMEPPCLDCKILDKIPKDKYYIFDKDIEFRKRRKERIIKDEIRTQEAKVELELHEHWLESCESLFKDLQKDKCDIEKNKHGAASVLCPVTWKTLELVCKYNILKNPPW
jgi:hypothetical protein